VRHWRTNVHAGYLLVISCFPSVLHAHGIESDGSYPAIWSLWTFEPGVVIPLLLAASLYAFGFPHLPRRLRRKAILFSAGWAVLAIALISPIHRLGSALFSIHMIQHELLMIAAAPLLVLGRPGVVMLRAFPPGMAQAFARWGEDSHLTGLWRRLTHPAVAWLVHALALWVWHAPALFEATLSHEWIHVLQHLSFFGTGLLFWSSVFRGPRRAADYGWGVCNLFLTALHSSVLGALITFAPHPWYISYTMTAPAWGISPLEDQQLGGLIMWIPGGIVYMIAGLLLFARWLKASRVESIFQADHRL
jgi:putative membrane protein